MQLVGYFHSCITDARIHERQPYFKIPGFVKYTLETFMVIEIFHNLSTVPGHSHDWCRGPPDCIVCQLNIRIGNLNNRKIKFVNTKDSVASYPILDLFFVKSINPLNAELNSICYLLALLGAHHFLHVSRIRVKSLTLRLLMSYIYIYIYIYIWSTYS